jgi:hypothetical protein
MMVQQALQDWLDEQEAAAEITIIATFGSDQ